MPWIVGNPTCINSTWIDFQAYVPPLDCQGKFYDAWKWEFDRQASVASVAHGERVEVPAAHEPSLYQHWLANLIQCGLSLGRKRHLQLQCGRHAVTTLSINTSKGVMSSHLDRRAGCQLCRPRPELQAH